MLLYKFTDYYLVGFLVTNVDFSSTKNARYIKIKRIYNLHMLFHRKIILSKQINYAIFSKLTLSLTQLDLHVYEICVI